jgi:putative membrane protein
MKPKNQILLFMPPAFFLCIAFSSCNNNNGQRDVDPKTDRGNNTSHNVRDAKSMAKDFNEKKSIDSKESKFLINAADMSLKEIDMAKIAQKNAASADVKNMSRTIESENMKYLDELKKLAQAKSITIPLAASDAANRKTKELEKLEGNNFDEKYCAAMVDDHKESVKNYKDAVENVEDVDIKNYATRMLPLLRDHLDHAMTCQQSHKGNENPEKKLSINKEVKVEKVAANKTGENDKSGDEKKDKKDKDGEKDKQTSDKKSKKD